MNQSTYFNYNLPQPNDPADISKINTNFANLDAFLHRTIGEGYSDTDTLDARVSAVEATENVLEKSATNSFDDGIDSYFKKVVLTIVPVQAGSGTPSPINERAISGFTECVVENFSKNFMPQKDVTVPNTSTNSYVELDLPKGTYTISAQVTTDSSDTSCRVSFRSGTTQIVASFIEVSATRKSTTVTLETDCNQIYFYGGNATTTYANTSYTDIQIERGSTATDYTPYVAPNTATISFGSAGTVYGARVELISGKLVVDRICLTPTSVDNVYMSGGNKYYWIVARNLTPAYESDLISSHFKSEARVLEGNAYISSNNLLAVPTDQTLNTKALADAWMATNTPQFVYKLATPQEYQLTPAQLRSLVGTNNLTSSTGEVTEVEYITNETIAWLLDLIRAN